MIVDMLLSGDIREGLITLLMWIPIILFSLSLHEAAHAYVAYRLGDPTARNFGRVTLNPAKHLEPFGFLTMLVLGVGWANPVPINPRHFENPRKGMALSSFAGPASNLMLALIMGFLCALFDSILVPAINPQTEEAYMILVYVYRFLYYGVALNVSLAVFNLIPVPPLDGSRIIGLILPPKYYFSYMKYEKYIGIAFLVIVLVLSRLGISLISWITEPIINAILWLFETPFYLIAQLIW